MDHVNYVLVLLIGLLCSVAAVAGLARRFAVSYPIVLVIFGLLCSLIPRVPPHPTSALVGVPRDSAAPSLCGRVADVVARVRIQPGVDLKPGRTPGILHRFWRGLCSKVVAAGVQL